MICIWEPTPRCPNGLIHFCRGRDGGVAKGIVIDILFSHHRRALTAELEQLPDAVAVNTQKIGFLIEHK